MIQICRKGKAELYPPPYNLQIMNGAKRGREATKASDMHATCTHAHAHMHLLTQQQRGFFFSFLLYVCMKKKREGGGGLGGRTKKVKKSFDFFFLNYSFLACLGWFCSVFLLGRASCIVHRGFFFFCSVWVFWEARKVWAMWENTVSRNLRLGRIDVAQAPSRHDPFIIWDSFHVCSDLYYPFFAYLRYGEIMPLIDFYFFFSLSFSLSRAHEGGKRERERGRGVAIKRFWRWRIHIHK